MQKKIINIGIVAHVDAGKTSLTELFLYKSGAIRSPGSVDKGTSQSDSLEVEKERGISVRSSSASFKWNQVKINLIDTPGHIDFSAEVERSLQALDCAVIVLSAVEGVQAHTDTLWKVLRIMNIPTLIFINKIDRMGADTEVVIRDIKKELSNNIVLLQTVYNEGENEAYITDIRKSMPDEFVESVIQNDDALLNRYFDAESLQPDEILTSMTRQIRSNHLFPVFCGSAKFDVGINELLDAITQFMPVAIGNPSSEVSGIVYKIEHDSTFGRMASVRLFSGLIKNRDTIFNTSQEKEEKVNQIKKFTGLKYEDVGELLAGDIGILSGMSTVKAGDIIGRCDIIREALSLQAPLLTVKVMSQKPEEYPALVKAMQILSDEDPKIDLLWLQDNRELHIKIMGIIQLEVLENILKERFELKVIFGKPAVICKETPRASVEGYEEYTMPKPCWAVVRFKIDPAARGSGVSYHSEMGINEIAQRYQNEIERTIPLALKQGILGWGVTDLKITLIGGEHHNIHSRAGDFAVATPMAIMNGLKEIGTILLEPMLAFVITGPEESLGKVLSSLTQLRAELDNPLITDEKFRLKGTYPVSTSMDYTAKLSALTGGKGKLETRFSGYRECPLDLGDTTPFKGVSPLDRSKYILQARKAL